MPKRKKPQAKTDAKKARSEVMPSKTYAARTRLYELVRDDGDSLILENREGIRFRHPTDGDAEIIGGVPTARKTVTRREAVEHLAGGRFAWLHFVKADGTDREMLAQMGGPSPDLLSIRVRDLEKTAKADIGRQFRIDRLRAYMLPDDPTYYKLKAYAD